jgi:hypothetical protein
MFERVTPRIDITDSPDLISEEQAYFRVHGFYPPMVSPDATVEELEAQIQSIRTLAEATHDWESSERLAHEIGFLINKLDRRNG